MIGSVQSQTPAPHAQVREGIRMNLPQALTEARGMLAAFEPPPQFTGNRALRRTRDAFERARQSRHFSKLMRVTAWITTAAMLHMIFAGTPGSELMAQPNFDSFE